MSNLTTGRISCGVPALDAALGGGLPLAGISVLAGAPGSGKTVLAQQCVFTNARSDAPALYLSTVSEPLEKILRYGQTLSFFDARSVGVSVFYDELGTTLRDRGLPGVVDRVRDMVRERRPSLIVIDSMKALHPYADTRSGLRRFLHDLAGVLSGYPVTTIWVGEYEHEDLMGAPEFAVADAIILLEAVQSAERTARALEIRKLRGGDFIAGKHAYRLSADGLTVFPRLADTADEKGYELSSIRAGSGIQALDDMLGSGYWPGISTLLVGPTGVGKTTLGLHYAFHGAHHGESVVIATVQEDPTQLERIAQQFGWSLEHDKVTLMYRSPVDLYIDEWVHGLLNIMVDTGATRVLVDSLGVLRSCTPDATRFREYLYSLLRRCARQGVGLMLACETGELYGTSQLTDHDASQLVDNVVLLQYRHLGTALSRALTILKTRAMDHNHEVREFQIGRHGITLTPTGL